MATDSEKRPRWVAKFTQLAEVLGVHRTTLNRWRELPGAPQRRANGGYLVEEWETFGRLVSTRFIRTDRESMAEIRARDLRAQIAEKREVFRAYSDGYAAVEVASKDLDLCEQTERVLFRRIIVEGLPPKVAGMPVAEVLEACRAANDAFCRAVQEAPTSSVEAGETADDLDSINDIPELRKRLLETTTEAREYRVAVRRKEHLPVERLGAIVADSLQGLRSYFNQLVEGLLPSRLTGKSRSEAEAVCREAFESYKAMQAAAYGRIREHLG